MPDNHAYETKDAADVDDALGEMHRAFATYKDANERRLAEIERRGAPDVLITDKLARLDRALDELSLKNARPQLGNADAARSSFAAREHKAAFEGYVRRGEVAAIRTLESKALSAGSDPDGGYLVPPETEAAVNRSLVNISPIRAISKVRQVSGTMYRMPYSIQGPGSGWVAEVGVRPATASPQLAELLFPTMELYAMPAATSTLLDDAIVNIDQWIADEVRIAFAQQEGQAFVTGDGVNKPKGFLAYPIVADAAWSWGNVGFVSTNNAGAFPTTGPGDKLIELVYAVRSGYRANGTFVMNRATEAVIRKMKSTTGEYLWEPAAKPGESPTLMGYPIAEAEDMPNIATDATPIAFGDFQRGYLIVDRVGIRILRDPYSSKPYVLFYTTKRVGGGIQDFAAIKLLKFSA